MNVRNTITVRYWRAECEMCDWMSTDVDRESLAWDLGTIHHQQIHGAA